MTKPRIAIIVSYVNYAIAFEWMARELQQVAPFFIFLNPTEPELKAALEAKGHRVYHLPYSGKKTLWKTFWQLVSILKKEKPNAVHCHLVDAGLIGLSAALWCGIKKRIYTRHHAGANILYHKDRVKYDRWINRLATHIVVISDVVKKVLLSWEGVNPKKLRFIPHGFDLEYIAKRDDARIAAMKAQYGLQDAYPVVGVVSRYLKLKGIQYIIPAFRQFTLSYPNAVLLLAGGGGEYAGEIQNLLKTLPAKNYREIGHIKDLNHLYALFDIYVHVPIKQEAEAFGQTYVESAAAGIPGIFTASGVAAEYIINRKNALVVQPKNSDDILQAFRTITGNRDQTQAMTLQAKEDVYRLFTLELMIQRLEALYAE